MLDSELYNIVSIAQEEGLDVFLIELNGNHPLYAGHFPTMPILPGVCTLHIIKSCAAIQMGCKVRFQSIKECKFLALITPEKQAQLEIRIEQKEKEENKIEIRAWVLHQDTIMMKMKGVLCTL